MKLLRAGLSVAGRVIKLLAEEQYRLGHGLNANEEKAEVGLVCNVPYNTHCDRPSLAAHVRQASQIPASKRPIECDGAVGEVQRLIGASRAQTSCRIHRLSRLPPSADSPSAALLANLRHHLNPSSASSTHTTTFPSSWRPFGVLNNSFFRGGLITSLNARSAESEATDAADSAGVGGGDWTDVDNHRGPQADSSKRFSEVEGTCASLTCRKERTRVCPAHRANMRAVQACEEGQSPSPLWCTWSCNEVCDSGFSKRGSERDKRGTKE
ncbi:hypothetical protein RTBOTA2_005599 [Rhodotorula toruloides]|nr:hypothetical protein RTBOTA2_005599 [Rhodotorula toruloides]